MVDNNDIILDVHIGCRLSDYPLDALLLLCTGTCKEYKYNY